MEVKNISTDTINFKIGSEWITLRPGDIKELPKAFNDPRLEEVIIEKPIIIKKKKKSSKK